MRLSRPTSSRRLSFGFLMTSELSRILTDLVDLGGPGSGNWGHAGRPGKVGGSAPGGGLGKIGASKADSAEQRREKSVATRHGGMTPPAEPAIPSSMPAGYRPATQNMAGSEWDGYMPPIPNSNTSEKRLEAFAHSQGFDGLPTVVDKAQMDTLLDSSGYIELHRGLKANLWTTAAEARSDFRSGQCYFGSGIYGNGIYTSAARAKGAIGDAKAYTGKDRSVLRMALSKDAKMIDHQEVMRRIAASSNTSVEPGEWAVRNGFDAIRIPKNEIRLSNGPARDDYYIILNRTAVFVQNSDLRF